MTPNPYRLKLEMNFGKKDRYFPGRLFGYFISFISCKFNKSSSRTDDLFNIL